MDKKEQILYTTKFGMYYNPASKHYMKHNANIVCNNCGKENLTSCIGHADVDICLPCVENLNTEPYTINSRQIPPGTMCGWTATPM